MPRRRRTWVPDVGAHSISRFVDRRFHLIDDDDRRFLFDAIARADHRWDWVWLSYAAMSSHVHYGHIAGVADPDPFFRSVNTRFAMRYHRRQRGVTLGPVFADRPVIHPVGSWGISRMVAYHHRNPDSAGVVKRPRDSTWTSHRAYLRLDPAPKWLNVERALSLLGFSDTAAGRRRFDDFVSDVDLSELPSDPAVGRDRRVVRAGGRIVDWPHLIGVARDVAGVHPREPIGSRRRAVVKARLLVATIATKDLGQTYSAVATKLEVKTGSVFNLLHRNEDTDLEAPLRELRERLAS